MSAEPKSGLEFYPPGAQQPDLLVNPIIYWLAVWGQAVVLEITATPPGGEDEGDIYLAAPSATGAWAGHDNEVVYCTGPSAYLFFPPEVGYLLYNIDDDTEYRFDTTWNPVGSGGGGGASIGVQYLSDLGSTADSDPGPGLLKWNNATQASATVLFLDDSSVDGASLTGFWSALVAGGFAYLQHATDQDVWQIWEITAVTDATGYVKLGVTLLSKGTDFADDAPMLVTLEQGAPGGGTGIVETIVAGTGISVDSTDPANPIVTATDGGGSVAGSYAPGIAHRTASRYFFNDAGGAIATTANPTANRVYYYPFTVGQSLTSYAVGMIISSPTAGKVRIAIRENTNAGGQDGPGTLLQESVDLSTLATPTFDPFTAALTPGVLYWIQACCSTGSSQQHAIDMNNYGAPFLGRSDANVIGHLYEDIAGGWTVLPTPGTLTAGTGNNYVCAAFTF